MALLICWAVTEITMIEKPTPAKADIILISVVIKEAEKTIIWF